MNKDITQYPFGQFEPEQNPAIYEIAPGATVEEVTALFFDDKALKLAPEPLYRLDRNGHRYYYRFDETGQPDFFPSITTLISQTLPTSQFLIKWIADIGFDRAEEYKNERAKYGTFMHGEYAEMLITRQYNLDSLKTRLLSYMENNFLPFDFVDYADDLRKNMLSLAQFILDYDVEPVAIEMPLLHPYMRYGATLDLVCWLTLDGQRQLVIVDFKSGKGFYESNEVQLHAQKEAWNFHFEPLPIKRVFNWRPKDWRNKPTYHFCEQTQSPNAEKLQYIVAIAQVEDKKLDNMLTICDGVIDLDKGIADNYKVYTLADLVKRKKEEKAPDEKTAINEKELEGKNTESKPSSKKPATGKKKAATGKKTEKRGNVPKEKEKPVKEIKKPKSDGKRNLLNNDPEI